LGLGTPTVETTLTSPSFSLASPGGNISFDVNFITTDGTNNFADFALVQLVPSEGTPTNLFVANTTCADCAAVPPAVLNPGVATMSPTSASFLGTTVTLAIDGDPAHNTLYGNVPKYGTGPGGPTGWIHVTYPAPAGNYTLRFFVTHVGDINYPTALAIDNVHVENSQTQTVFPGQTTTFNFEGGFAAGGYDYTVHLNTGSATNVQLTPIIKTQAQCDALVNVNFPGAHCFVYQKAAGDGTNFAAMFELTCPDLPGSECATFDAELGTDYHFDKTFNPGFNKFDPFPGWLKGRGPDTAHPCTPDPNPANPLLQSNQIDFFQVQGDPTGVTKGGSGGTGSCWVATYNTPNEVPPGITINSPTATTYTLNQTVAASYFCSDPTSSKLPQVSNPTGPYLTNVAASCLGPIASGTNIDTSAAALGPHTFTVNAIDTGSNTASKSVTYNVAGYQPAGTTCFGDAGHQVLQPINPYPAQPLSVFKGGSTIPVKFRVCDVNGVSIGTAGVVTSNPFACTITGSTGSPIDETVTSATPDTNFRWDSTNQQWIFNWGTKGLTAGGTKYSCTINLNDNSKILFSLALK